MPSPLAGRAEPASSTPLLVLGEPEGYPSGRIAALALVDSNPDVDGLFCINDAIAIGALRGLAEAGWDVPGRIRVIGFDNIGESAFTTPGLSTVDPDLDFIARSAIALIRAQIDGPPSDGRILTSGFTIVERGSTL